MDIGRSDCPDAAEDRLDFVMDWVFVAPQNSYIETLTPKMTVFGSEIFEGQSDLDEVMRMVFLAVMYGYES